MKKIVIMFTIFLFLAAQSGFATVLLGTGNTSTSGGKGSTTGAQHHHPKHHHRR